MSNKCFEERPFVFRIHDSHSIPQLLTQVCLERGWREHHPEKHEQWNLWWRISGFPISHHRNLYAWQYINHIPKGSLICRKDNLVRSLRCMKKVYGPIYDFSPSGYNLPLEYTKLAAECSRNISVMKKGYEIDNHHNPIWICKPAARSQGKGIFLFKELNELSYNTNAIVQRYIEKPLLIGGYKFDLRLYVCIPSYHPITVYLYKEGLVRFGTDKFKLNDLENPFGHLTNSSINKLGPKYMEMKESIGSGCKWSFCQLRQYFQQVGISDWLLWQKISVIVVLTLISQVEHIPPTINCFEFFGFDILIDNELKPWLLEVNLSPALGNDCDVDRLVKKPMLHDMFDLLGFPSCNMALSIYNLWNGELEEYSRRVMYAAERWKKTKKTVDRPLLREKSVLTRMARTSSANSKISLPYKEHLNFQNMHAFQEELRTTQTINKEVQFKGITSNDKWGNGRDWRQAPPYKGSWVRVWPMNLCVNYLKSSQCSIKSMVFENIKFSKAVRDIYRNYPAASECQFKEYLQKEINMSREIWIPPARV